MSRNFTTVFWQQAHSGHRMTYKEHFLPPNAFVQPLNDCSRQESTEVQKLTNVHKYYANAEAKGMLFTLFLFVGAQNYHKDLWPCGNCDVVSVNRRTRNVYFNKKYKKKTFVAVCLLKQCER